MDQPPIAAFTTFADMWPRAMEMEIGTAQSATGTGKNFDFDHLSRSVVCINQLFDYYSQFC